jgi:SAM-dependent methyltransferase
LQTQFKRMKQEKQWFEAWFDTSYYHSLYKNRNDEEAQLFIQAIVDHLGINANIRILDLACGKGRHAKYLNSLGMDVTGVDLSQNSIQFAQQFSNERLQFHVHDMREVLNLGNFDIVLNLFTSFGYFDSLDENLKVLNAIHTILPENGILLLDFFNATKVISNLCPFEIKTEDGIDFHIRKEYDGKHIFKHIEFQDNNEKYHFTERVQALKKEDFIELLNQSAFELKSVHGNFQLEEFNEEHSDRCIIIAQKK